MADGTARAVVVISKNANVATGRQGHDDALEVAAASPRALGCDPTDVLVASTGVIGRRYPIDRIRAGIAATSERADVGLTPIAPARGMMTTDTVPKIAEATVAGSTARVVGVAKGVGMIEPDMATLITLLFTDAELSTTDLDAAFRRVIDRTFNCVTVDTDTSTSDTAVDLGVGCGRAGRSRRVRGGAVRGGTRSDQADRPRRRGRPVADRGVRRRSPRRRSGQAGGQGDRQLTAGEDRCARRRSELGPGGDGDRQVQRRHRHRTGRRRDPLRRHRGVPALLDDAGLAGLSNYMRSPDVRIHVSLDTGDAAATVWGCDLTDDYVRFNADYTT